MARRSKSTIALSHTHAYDLIFYVHDLGVYIYFTCIYKSTWRHQWSLESLIVFNKQTKLSPLACLCRKCKFLTYLVIILLYIVRYKSAWQTEQLITKIASKSIYTILYYTVEIEWVSCGDSGNDDDGVVGWWWWWWWWSV